MQEERSEVAAKQASDKAKSSRVFGQARKPTKMFRAGLYARVSTSDQQTIPLQIRVLRDYALRRGWTIALQVKEVGSGASQRELREKLLEAARRREIDVVAGVALGSVGSIRSGPAGNAPGTGASGSRFRVADRGTGPDDAGGTGDGRLTGRLRRVREGYSPRASPCRLGPTRGRTARNWAGPSQQASTSPGCGSCIVLASAKPRSLADCRSVAPRCAAFWRRPNSRVRRTQLRGRRRRAVPRPLLDARR